MAVRVVIHDDGIDDLLGSPQASRLVADAAREVADAARELAPDGGPHRGVKETYKSTVATKRTDGVSASAYTDDMAGHLVEFGSVNNPAYAPLRRAAQRVGLRLRLLPKGS